MMTPAKPQAVPKAIRVVNAKGGVGKTMCSLQVAGALASAGQKVQLIDLDPQGGSMTWAGIARSKGREPTFRVGTSPVSGYDWTVYDHPPGLPQSVNLAGEVALVPTVMTKGDWAATVRFIQELQGQNARFLVLPNRVENTSDQQDMLAQLFPEQPFLPKRSGLVRAFNNGVTVYDEKNGVPLGQQIRQEFDVVMAALMALLKGEPSRRYSPNGLPL